MLHTTAYMKGKSAKNKLRGVTMITLESRLKSLELSVPGYVADNS